MLQSRDYQKRIVKKVTDLFSRGIDTVLVDSPTGSGKTVMGLLVAKLLQRHDPGMPVFWMALRRNLLAQTERQNQELGINVQNLHLVSVFQRELPPDIGRGLLVADECHHDACNSSLLKRNQIDPDYVLGLTATAFRSDKLKLQYKHVVRDAGINQLVQEGWLSQYIHWVLPEYTVQSVVDCYLNEPHRWGKSVMYFLNLQQCRQAAQALESAGVSVELVHGGSNWQRQLDAFSRDQIRVLVSCMKLTEGFDEPSLQTVFVRDGSRGPTVQMAGRVFRKYPGIEHKNIVQSKNTKYNIQRLVKPIMFYSRSDGRWVGSNLSDTVLRMRQTMLAALQRQAVAKAT